MTIHTTTHSTPVKARRKAPSKTVTAAEALYKTLEEQAAIVLDEDTERLLDALDHFITANKGG